MDKENNNPNLTNESKNLENTVTEGTPAAGSMGELSFDGSSKAEASKFEAADEKAEDTAESIESAIESTVEDTLNAAPYADEAGVSVMAAAVIEEKPKSKKMLPIIGGVVLLLLIAAISLVATGVLAKPSDKVLMAIDNTFKPDQVTEKLSAINEISSGGKYTMDMDASLSGGMLGNIDVNLSYVQDSSTALQSAKGSLSFMGTKFNLHEYMDDKNITLSIPELVGEKALTYNYIDKKSGYIVSAVGKKDLDVVDSYLQYMHSVIGMDKSKIQKDMIDVFRKDIGTLKFEKTPEKDIKFDNGNVKCKGYSVVIDSTFADKLFKDIKAVYGEENFDAYLKTVSSMNALAGGTASVSTEDEIQSAIDNMETLNMRFYLNKNNLAAVEFESKAGETFSIEFVGSEIPWHHTRLTGDGNSTVSLNVKNDGTKETFEILSDEVKLFTLTYDLKSGDFTFKNDYTELNGSLKEESGKYIFKLEYEGLKAAVTVSNGGKVEKINASTVDIGNADEQTINDIMEHVGNALMNSSSQH